MNTCTCTHKRAFLQINARTQAIPYIFNLSSRTRAQTRKYNNAMMIKKIPTNTYNYDVYRDGTISTWYHDMRTLKIWSKWDKNRHKRTSNELNTPPNRPHNQNKTWRPGPRHPKPRNGRSDSRNTRTVEKGSFIITDRIHNYERQSQNRRWKSAPEIQQTIVTKYSSQSV